MGMWRQWGCKQGISLCADPSQTWIVNIAYMCHVRNFKRAIRTAEKSSYYYNMNVSHVPWLAGRPGL